MSRLFFASLLMLMTSVQQSSETLRLIHAHEFKRDMVGGKVRQSLIGQVEFRQAGTIVTCHRAEQIMGLDPVSLLGNVRIVDENDVLRADTVFIYQETKIQVAKGSVKSITEEDTTTADKITYYQDDRRVDSEGNVRVARRGDRTVVTGGRALYLRESDFGRIFENPVFVQLDSLKQEFLHVTGDTMDLYSGSDTTIVRGNVRIRHKKTIATCGRADYFKNQERTLLTQSPKVIQPNQEITGDSLELDLQGSELTRAVVKGNALATSDADTSRKGRWINKLTGQQMTFYFSDEVLEQIIVENQATSLYHVIEGNTYRGANEVSGDKIRVDMKEGVVKNVSVVSDPEFSSGKYIPPKPD